MRDLSFLKKRSNQRLLAFIWFFGLFTTLPRISKTNFGIIMGGKLVQICLNGKACPNLSKRENLSISTAKFKILFWLSYIFLGLASVTFVSRVTKLGNSAFPQCFHSVADIQGPAFILFRRTQLGLKLVFMDHEIKYPRIFRLIILSDLLPMKATRYRGWFMKFKTKQFHNSKKIHRAWLKRSFHDI